MQMSCPFANKTFLVIDLRPTSATALSLSAWIQPNLIEFLETIHQPLLQNCLLWKPNALDKQEVEYDWCNVQNTLTKNLSVDDEERVVYQPVLVSATISWIPWPSPSLPPPVESSTPPSLPLFLDNNVSYLSIFSSMFFADTSLPKTVLNPVHSSIPNASFSFLCNKCNDEADFREKSFPRQLSLVFKVMGVLLRCCNNAPHCMQQCMQQCMQCMQLSVCSVLGKRQCWTWWAWWLGRDHARSHPGSHVQGENILQQHHRHPHQHHHHHYLTNLKSKNIAKIAKVP